MTTIPEFPQLRPIQLEDRDFIREVLGKYEPQTSEWSFTNLFIWRSHYRFQWSMYQDWLVVLCSGSNDGPYALQPIGPSPRLDVTRMLLKWLWEEKGEALARIERADQRFVSELEGATDLLVESTRDQFDYVYRSEDLIKLAGRKYHSKRNHINKFRRSYSFTYMPFSNDHLKPCLELADSWCEWRRCEEDLNLVAEWDAVREALKHFKALEIEGGVILIENEVKAFALGELLNDQMATVHIEKADPEIPGLYAMINQQFCENCWKGVPFVNREQDLGEPGLRKAKLSYYPDHLVKKFRIRLAG
ncbi:MAG: DUF2156 domain-containing protein [Deltaproteobacteria bacterium]|nr:MAG: DUF2156 domain-containing protein [Deltaproteobacteria bacterium]